MTVQTQVNKVLGSGNGVATTFSFSPMVLTAHTDLVVTLVTSAGVSTAITEGVGGSNYSLNVTSYPGTGSLTYPASGSTGGTVLPTGTQIVMKRVLTLQQTTHLSSQGGYFPDIQEAGFDYLTMIDLQQEELIDRAIRFNITDATAPIDLPPAAQRANMGLVFDANGQVTAGVLSSVAVSSAMTPVVQAVTLAAGRTALGSGATGDSLFTAASTAAVATILGYLSAGVNTLASLLTLKSTTAGAGIETLLTLLRNKGAGAASDVLEALSFDGMSSTSVQRTFAKIYAGITTATNAAEQGFLKLGTIVAGAYTDVLTLGLGVQVGAPTGGDKGAGTVNATGYYLNGTALVSKIAQVVNTETGTVATGSTIVPDDNTIPQNTEGDQYMTLAITPTNSSSTLLIDVVWIGAASTAGVETVALFQDTTANALAAAQMDITTAANMRTVAFRHKMTAGTTSATTFKVRAGLNGSATTTFNGSAGSQTLGGVMASSITITEVLP